MTDVIDYMTKGGTRYWHPEYDDGERLFRFPRDARPEYPKDIWCRRVDRCGGDSSFHRRTRQNQIRQDHCNGNPKSNFLERRLS